MYIYIYNINIYIYRFMFIYALNSPISQFDSLISYTTGLYKSLFI